MVTDTTDLKSTEDPLADDSAALESTELNYATMTEVEAAGIIGWLVVVESDVAHNLAEMRTLVSSRNSAFAVPELAG